MLRLDRNDKSKKKNGESKKGGGGLIAFVRRGYKLVKYEFSSDFETIYFQLLIKNENVNFIHSYKPPHTDNLEFLNHIEVGLSESKSNKI